jgi:hypothetical protein
MPQYMHQNCKGILSSQNSQDIGSVSNASRRLVNQLNDAQEQPACCSQPDATYEIDRVESYPHLGTVFILNTSMHTTVREFLPHTCQLPSHTSNFVLQLQSKTGHTSPVNQNTCATTSRRSTCVRLQGTTIGVKGHASPPMVVHFNAPTTVPQADV